MYYMFLHLKPYMLLQDFPEHIYLQKEYNLQGSLIPSEYLRKYIISSSSLNLTFTGNYFLSIKSFIIPFAV